jgi:phosphohistidine phosphatase
MQIYMLRHGIAEDARPGTSDRDRALTKEGVEKLRKVLAVARQAGVSPGLILTSPLRRAVETAQIAAETLDYKQPILHTDVLVPSSSPEAVWAEIRAHRSEAAILLAGHEPLLGETVSYLLGSSRVLVEMKKGALVRIDVVESGATPRGSLQWLLTPKLAAGRA